MRQWKCDFVKSGLIARVPCIESIMDVQTAILELCPDAHGIGMAGLPSVKVVNAADPSIKDPWFIFAASIKTGEDGEIYWHHIATNFNIWGELAGAPTLHFNNSYLIGHIKPLKQVMVFDFERSEHRSLYSHDFKLGQADLLMLIDYVFKKEAS